MYGFDEGMLITMDLGNPDINQDNMDIWVLVDTPPVLSLCEFLKHSYQLIYIVYFKIVDNLFPLTAYFHSSKNVREMVGKTHYTDGSELTYKEKIIWSDFVLTLRITISTIKLLNIMVNTCHQCTC